MALASVCQWLERQPMHQRVTASIPRQGTYLGFRFDPRRGQGMCVQEAINQWISFTLIFLSHSASLPPSLSTL